ncbi:SH3 domain-containing protein [Flavobacterium sp.]|uniref:SH3 domain-containing protein n=1 Tax=Flavobacterium sp. TaxID=239 RepID=UPI00286E28B7|nr:SH3 domain-containing protein [Flavobacterium sp.]
MKSNVSYLLLLLLMFLVSCNGQTNKTHNCSSKDNAIKIISDLKEVKLKQKYIDSISNKTRGVSFVVNEEKIKEKDCFEVKAGYNGKLRWETYYIFYVNKNKCEEIYINDPISGDIINLNEWRKHKTKKIKKMETKEIHFYDLLREGQTVKFTPNDLDENNAEIKEFKKKLENFENQNSLPEDFKEENLRGLINNETFSNAEGYIDSSWFNYFIKKYKIDVTKQNELMYLAIKQEDYNAAKILLNCGYILSLKELEIVVETKNNSIKMQKFNKSNKGLDESGDPTFYEDKESKIKEIESLLNRKYLSNQIQDVDGYTNLRKGKSKESEILQKIITGEKIQVLDNSNDWYLIKTKSGNQGYVFKTKIKSE